jgi:hypothetical protein
MKGHKFPAFVCFVVGIVCVILATSCTTLRKNPKCRWIYVPHEGPFAIYPDGEPDYIDDESGKDQSHRP